ncbi:MAG: UDP-N-acetylmuramate dehydrogenase [Chloroflexota bacterium]|nr:UDP-N-acetylmuramate dehydrogenase [Chloroflexota bacterium]
MYVSKKMELILMGKSEKYRTLLEAYGERLKFDVPLARYTAAMIGGPADALLEVHTSGELVEAVKSLWNTTLPFTLLGAGSNVLVCDDGVRGGVIVNRARSIEFDEETELVSVWAESGTNFGLIARQAGQRGLGGLEWAAGIPGTLGGAVVGNAGAHGSNIAGCLILAEILHNKGAIGSAEPETEIWTVEDFQYQYRSSRLKQQLSASQENGNGQPAAVVLSARLRLEPSTPQQVLTRMEKFASYRRETQPPGASMGSMFKNPPGDYAGRLIEAVGLKGARLGDAQISPLHANFFINLGKATASDVLALIDEARTQVKEEFGIDLELEIEIVGEQVN